MKKTKIYFVCPSNKFVTGGVKQIYRQVETLVRNGFDAYILTKHKSKEDKRWFGDTNIPMVYSPYILKLLKYAVRKTKVDWSKKLVLKFLEITSQEIEKDAILVFPEIYGKNICNIEPDVRKVIFNQNCYYTFGDFSIYEDHTETPYNHQKTLATITISEDSLHYLNYTFPEANTYKMQLGINHTVFNFSDKKKKQIAFMPRKLKCNLEQVINILKQRKILNDWKLVAIDNKTEEEVAQIMKESVFFLSFSHREGFGLPPAEAMACGCYVIGYHGQGGKEFFEPDFSTVVDEGDIIEFVKKIEEKLSEYERNPYHILQKGKKASEFILSRYSLEKEEKDTVYIWNEILKLHTEKR